MSRQWQSHQDAHQSPLDQRPQNAYLSEQGPAFQTNVNRSKTKKWVEAKSFSYDGDDWGDYDEQDEYGAGQSPPPAQQPASQQPAFSGRNFTDTYSGQALGRKNSFDRGDERRAFSGPQQPPLDSRDNASWDQSARQAAPSYQTPEQHDYSQPPLQSRNPIAVPGQNSMMYPPPRKSSLSQDAPPAPLLTENIQPSARDRSPSAGTASPASFVRPADIYKRMAEAKEKERASQESSRPSMDSLGARSADDRAHGTRADDRTQPVGASRLPLQTVAERKSEYIPALDAAQDNHGSVSTVQPDSTFKKTELSAPGPVGGSTLSSPELPELKSTTGFGDEFWSSAGTLGAGGAAPAATTSQPPTQPLRDVVDQAFIRTDDNSVPPTPVSANTGLRSVDDTGVSRSNTESSAGLSPIMSRVPNSATAASRAQATEAKMGTPAIKEESADAAGSGLHVVNRKPSPTHSRNQSVENVRKSLVSPSPSQSPARSPIVSASGHVPRASVGEIAVADLPQDYATREADLAKSTNPDHTVASIAEKENDAQRSFLNKHQPLPTLDTSSRPVSRGDSPSKSRVRDLAGKFDDIADSRRNSWQSDASRKSATSPARGRAVPAENTGSPRNGSPLKERPLPQRDLSFRPHLPGQWESYTTTPGVETPQDDARDRSLGPTVSHNTGATGLPTATADENVDLAPTKSKQTPAQRATALITQDPLAALQAAGVAIGDSLKSTIVGNDDNSASNPTDPRNRSVGNVFGSSRPLAPQRLDTDATVTTAGPPSPEKEEPSTSGQHLSIAPIAPLQPRSREGTPGSSPKGRQSPGTRPHLASRVSTSSWPATDDSEDDDEKLESDIVKSLGAAPPPPPKDTSLVVESGIDAPAASSQTTATNPARASTGLDVPMLDPKRDSSILPAEYDTYWAGAGTTDVYPLDSNRFSAHAPEVVDSAAPATTSPAAQAASAPKLDRRFSWERGDSTVPTPAAATALQVDPMLTSTTGPSTTDKSLPEPIVPPHREESVVSSLHEPTNKASSPILTDLERTVSPIVPTDNQPTTTHSPTTPHKPSLDLPASPSTPITSSTKTLPPAPTLTSSTAHSTSPPQPQQPQTRIPPFREILAIKSPADRIQTYNTTRTQFATMDSGIRSWLQTTISKHPEHADILSLPSKPLPSAPTHPIGGSARHRHAPSLSLFTSSGGSPSTTAGAAAGGGGVGTGSPAQGTPTTAGGGKINKAEMQAKGRELFDKAGVLGGKASLGAKGLFAKGRSRFGRGGEKEQ